MKLCCQPCERLRQAHGWNSSSFADPRNSDSGRQRRRRPPCRTHETTGPRERWRRRCRPRGHSLRSEQSSSSARSPLEFSKPRERSAAGALESCGVIGVSSLNLFVHRCLATLQPLETQSWVITLAARRHDRVARLLCYVWHRISGTYHTRVVAQLLFISHTNDRRWRCAFRLPSPRMVFGWTFTSRSRNERRVLSRLPSLRSDRLSTGCSQRLLDLVSYPARAVKQALQRIPC